MGGNHIIRKDGIAEICPSHSAGFFMLPDQEVGTTALHGAGDKVVLETAVFDIP